MPTCFAYPDILKCTLIEGGFMSGISLAQAQTQLNLWLEADAAVSRGQEYSIDGKTLKRADAQVITTKIDYWKNEVRKAQQGGGIKLIGGTY